MPAEAEATRAGSGIESCAVLGVSHSGLSEGIRGLLSTVFDSVLLVGDARSLLAGVDAARPELVVLDLALAPGRGLELVSRLRAGHRELRILALVCDDDPELARAIENAGADGCLLSSALGDELLRAVEVLRASGRAFWSSAATGHPGRRSGAGGDGGARAR